MDQEKIKGILANLQKNLIENKTNQLVLLGAGAVLVILMSFTVLFMASRYKKTEDTIPAPVPTLIPVAKPTSVKNETEKIQSAGWSINCQVVVTTSRQKKFLRKFNHCSEKLQYIISGSGDYLVYIYQDKEKKYQLSVYSLSNNAEAILNNSLTEVLDFKFTSDNNLGVLIDQKLFSYYLIPMLFADYPTNFDLQTNLFTNLTQRKTDITLPTFSSPYASIQVDNGKINLLGDTNKILYALGIKDLNSQIIPVAQKNPKEKYNWQNRVIYVGVNNKLDSVDINGDNNVTHNLSCDGQDIDIGTIDPLSFVRSPDATQLAFVLSNGSIAIFDLIKDQCEVTAAVESRNFHENMSFSPNGLYLAYVNKGLNLYRLQDKQIFQLLSYSPDNFDKPMAITGPLQWSSDSRFICMAVSKVEGDSITKKYTVSNTFLTRAYFDSNFIGNVQQVVGLTQSLTKYACSPDGEKVIYDKDNSWYIYSLQNNQNSLFKTEKVIYPDEKIVWLPSGKIITDKWMTDETMKFTKLDLPSYFFSISKNEDVAAFSTNEETHLLKFYDLAKNSVIENNRSIFGRLLLFFY